MLGQNIKILILSSIHRILNVHISPKKMNFSSSCCIIMITLKIISNACDFLLVGSTKIFTLLVY